MIEPDTREPEAAPPSVEPVQPARPLIERLGVAFIALVMAVLFAALGIFAWAGNDAFLAVMAWIGALMTLWAGGSSVLHR